MLPLQFFGQNLHFAISLLSALVCFAVFWLYFDAWINRQDKKELFKWLGFLLVSISFVVHATIIEESVLGNPLFGQLTDNIANFVRLAGYGLIIFGLIIDPLQPRPKTAGLVQEDSDQPEPDKPFAKERVRRKSKKSARSKAQAILPAGLTHNLIVWLLPVGALAVSWLYWLRATRGMERHLRPVGWAFLAFTGFELVSLASLWQDTANPELLNLVKPFGPLWITAHLLLLAGAVILGRWVWRYLTDRFLSQLFMIFISITIAIFLLTAVSFTFLLMRNISDQSLNNLRTAAAVLDYALDSKKAETLANAELIAGDSAVATAAAAKDRSSLAAMTNGFLSSKKQTNLIILSNSGQVLLRADNPDNWGDSLSSDTLIQRALIGETSSTISTKEGVIAPVVYIRSATPVKDSADSIVGAAVVELVIDNSFVDGIKNSTGLDSSIYSGNARSATTFVAPDGKSRWVGIKEENRLVSQRVLKEGKSFEGQLNVLNRSFLAVYAPLKDVDNDVVGMLFIGQPQIAILQTAGRSIELTFLVTAALLSLAIIPSYVIARHLARQLA